MNIRPAIAKRIAQGGNYFAAAKDDIPFISSGSKILDLALGGGWAEKRVSNIVGDKSTGKTLLCIEAACNFAIKYPRTGDIFYRESEAAFLPNYAQALGLPLTRVNFGRDRIETVEDMFDDLCQITNGNRPTLYILDSLDALSDRAELAAAFDQGTYGTGKAKQMSKMFREMIRLIEQSSTTVIIVSQIRDKIGVKFGRKTTRSGGRALDFFATAVLYLAHLGTLTRTVQGVKRAVGIEVKAKVDKLKVGLPFREADFPILFGYGIDDVASCLAWAKQAGILNAVLNNMKQPTFEAMMREQHRPDQLRRMHGLIEHRWYDIERNFLPTRKKYGATP